MNAINKDELYHNLNGFLKAKGIELTEGSYARTIQKGCSILADAINLGQQGLERAKTGIDNKLNQMRQAIHEKTAPKPPATAASSASSGNTGTASASKPAARKGRSTKKSKSRKR